MKFNWSFLLLTLSLLAILIFVIIGNLPVWFFYMPVGLGLIGLIALLRGTILPIRVASRGFELIKSQDYNNRLVKVGEKNADRIIELFNSLIDKLRSERLINREQESLLSQLIDASPMGVVMLDFDRHISLVNSSFLKILGIKDNQTLSGKDFYSLKDDIVKEMIKVPLGSSQILRFGNFRVFRCYHLNFIKEGFKREFFLLESLTEEIRNAEKAAYEKVIRTISHEVNNTMGGVRSVLEIMESATQDEELGEVIESCHNRCQQMCSFISEYADVVRLSAPVLKKIDLNSEIKKMTPFIRQMVPSSINLKVDVANYPIYIKGDAGQLQQVVINIVKNAVESIAGEGEISIDVKGEKEGVSLIISNNGEPIYEEVSKELFIPFFTTKPEGKGIGLTFIREVLNHHNADYSLKTHSDGITRFVITFPLSVI